MSKYWDAKTLPERPGYVRISLHIFYKGDHKPEMEGFYYFTRVPVVGDYFATSHDSGHFEVQGVIHCPFEGADADAEVYAVQRESLPLKIADVL